MAAAAAGPASAAGHTKDPLPAVQQAVTAGQAVLIDVREPPSVFLPGKVVGAGWFGEGWE